MSTCRCWLNEVDIQPLVGEAVEAVDGHGTKDEFIVREVTVIHKPRGGISFSPGQPPALPISFIGRRFAKFRTRS